MNSEKQVAYLVNLTKSNYFSLNKSSTVKRSSFGAGNQNRTDDLVITNDVLYRLSHTSIIRDFVIITDRCYFVKSFFGFF